MPDDENDDRRRPPAWVSKWKDPGIIIIVLGLCVTTGQMMERAEDNDRLLQETVKVVAELGKSVTTLASQVSSMSNMPNSVTQITSATTKLEVRMDAAEKSDEEFRADMRAWMVRIENKIDQRERDR